MAEYRSKYYIFKASIKEQNITIKNAFKIRRINNLGPVFNIYLIVVNDWMLKNKQLEEDEVLFKAIEEEETYIKAEYKASANFATTKFNTKSEGLAYKRKIEFVEWSKYKKCGCKYLADQICK